MHRFSLKNVVICFLALLVLGTQIAFADELKDAKNQRIEINDQIKDTIQEKEAKENN